MEKKSSDIFAEKLKVINMGLKSFYESLKDQDTPVVHMDWKPPAGGNREMMDKLKELR